MPDFLLPKGHIISTEDVDEKEQLEYWIDMICDEFVQLDCTTGNARTSRENSAAVNSTRYGYRRSVPTRRMSSVPGNKSPNRPKVSSC